MRNALRLMTFLILNDFQIVSGVLEWTVIKRATDYGQNVTLFCNVPNCCPKLSGWDRWTPVQRTLFIDVKTGRPNKKYDGKVLKDGYTLIIQNLTTQDLNVSYSCLYGVTLGERKFLQAEDAFVYISATQPHGSSKLSEDDIIGLIIGIIALLAAVAVVVFLVYFVRQKKERTEPFDFEAIQSDKDMKEDRRYVRVLVIGKDGVGKTSLVRRLLGKNIKDTESTDGIDIVKECQIQRDNGKWIVGKVEQEKDQLRRRILEVIHKKQEESTPLSDLQPRKRRKKEHNLLQENENAPLVSAKEFRTEIFDIPTVSKMHINESVVNHTTTSNNSDRNIAHTVDTRKKKGKRNIEYTNEKDTTKIEIIHNSPVICSKKQNTDFNEETITEAIIGEMKDIRKFTKKKINTTKGLVDCGIWDFAGQKDYYATHQTFFTPDAIYLLVADIDHDIEAIKHDKINEFDSYGEYIDFWLDSIHCFCTDDKAEQLLPSVILVCTGIDRIPSEQVEEKKTIYRNKFHEIFGKEKRGNHCRYIHFISNTRSSETEITNLKNDISKIANELDYFEENLPTSWIQTETILMVVKNLGKKVISLKNFTKIADQNYIKDEELLHFLQYQHKIGSIIFFEDKSDYIILQPQWLVECFRCLVCDDQKRGVSIPYDMNNLKSRGELSEHLIDELFKKELNLKFGKYKDHILGVMEKFDIIVKPKSSNLNKNLYYMPCMITNASTLETIRNNFTIANCTPWLVLEFTFLPIAYYNHILFKYISNYEVCKIKSEDGDELLTVYLGKTVVYLDKTKCTLLVVCFSRNAISLQLWELTDEVKIDKSIYTNILKDLKEKIEEVKRQFMHNLHYEIKAKCSTGDFSSRFGRINSNNFSDMCVNGMYRCVEHDCMHRTDKLENTWFKQVSAQEDIETRRALLYSEVEELFKDHKGRKHLVLDKQLFVKATDKDDKEIESPKEAITELTFDHPCWGERMPNAWVPLELEIAEMVAAGKQIMSLEELKELNSISKVSVLNLEQLHDFLHFQHSLGKLIYFDTLQLQDYVIINPLLMVEVMRPFVKGFWPKKRRMQVIFSRMSESGIIRREDLYQIWEQKDFRPILRYKEFIFDILIHLDILSEQRRYDTATGSRLPVENFFVPCMVAQRNTTSFMNTECTPEKAICLAFVFKGTVIPPALPNRLIGACLSMWTLKQYEGRKLLFSGFIVVSLDKAHDVVVCVEGNKILLYLVHRTSAGLIVPDIATAVKECLVTTMERISDFYQSTINVKHGQQLPFHIEYSCSELKCFISEEEALQTNEWVCDKHKLTHRAGNWVVWNQDKIKVQCELHCLGLQDSALNQIPSDIELHRLSSGFDQSTIQKLAIHLGMTLQDWEALRSDYDRMEIVKYRILVNWREKYSGRFISIAKALTDMDIPVHSLCQVKRERRAETDIPLELLDCIPTDEILDKLAPQIGQVYFQFGVAMGLSIGTLEYIQSNNPRDLAAQNREVLFAWREDRTVKPTIRVLVQALVNSGRGSLCLQEVLSNVDPNTLGESKKVRDKGVISKKPNECSIA